ncbi:prepilin peptidase [Rhodobacter ferrooxidans]|uniref:Peptidase A24A prepilin type IV n=1 Tax=Rhodobacter ferrooxidans TaxID=371731 RepID=C8RXS0_9RHOB|nr:prepilin peptidase [Rhodobacter sp. SW2]EEW26318.1 peptidase A24A prepilin type IV [Rhodobacter sp. SW2]
MTPTVALTLLPFVLPIAVWVAWSDMKFMKIPNKAVLALAAVYLVVGGGLVAFGALGLKTWGWGWALGAIVLGVGFVVTILKMVGAGDAKFAAAMAPFFVGGDLRFVLLLFSACLIAAFVGHRAMRALPAVRRMTPDWESWTHAKFPMGLALSATLVFYLFAAILLH